jgi:ferredoxin-NADP reductase
MIRLERYCFVYYSGVGARASGSLQHQQGLQQMPERGAPPDVHPIQRRVLRALGSLSSPLLPDDYLELINPLWSTRELRGRIREVRRETSDAATISIKPGYRWPGHRPGQFLRIGVDIDGVRHWRAYSLTSDPCRPDGLISITVKNVADGRVSPFLVRRARPGAIVSLGGVEGDFVLPADRREALLSVTAGSGITPIMCMLRHLDRADEIDDVVLLHSARRRDLVIFGDELRSLRRHRGFWLHEQLTGERGRMTPEDLDRLCRDWRERAAYISGAGSMLDAFTDCQSGRPPIERRRRHHRSARQPAAPADTRAARGAGP